MLPYFVVKGMYLHRIFSSSRLVRLLSDLASVDVETSKQDVAERLGGWLGVFDAITLHAAHQSINTVDEKKQLDVLPGRPFDPEEEFHRVRTALVKSITASGASPASSKQLSNPVRHPGAATETDAGYAPYHQRYLDQQRQMALRIDALRAYIRQAITKVSPQLGQLAGFDTVMEQMLGGREQKLLSTVPVLLERRFEHLRTAQRQDDPALWPQAGGWLDVFGKELEEVLLAELEFRLQPVVGLIEAFSNEVKKYQ
ncbi:MAG: DUF3348 domain-containing protein [Polaromonas sp.]|nr:DUF3348 domain-containing protein [Polaromonas sp.]